MYGPEGSGEGVEKKEEVGGPRSLDQGGDLQGRGGFSRWDTRVHARGGSLGGGGFPGRKIETTAPPKTTPGAKGAKGSKEGLTKQPSGDPAGGKGVLVGANQAKTLKIRISNIDQIMRKEH